jgi:TonB family protein
MSMVGILPVLFPWHLPIWWQLARLRTAIEGDCDLRVLGRNPGSMRSYLELLIDVGEKSSGRRPLAVMLSEPYETLKRRIKIMTVPLPKKPWIRGTLLAGCGTVLVVLAGWAPAPTDARQAPSEPPIGHESNGNLPLAGEQQVAPTFTPYSVHPSIKNMDVLTGALAEAYRPILSDSAIGGTIELWFFVDETGRVVRTMVNKSSRNRALDDAAISIANVIEFNPALNRDQPKPVWVAIPIEFTVDEKAEEGGAEAGTALPISREWPDVPPVEPEIASETGDITGTTTDSATGEPVAFTQVYVPGTGLGTLSNRDGRFLIKDVPVGERLVVAEMVGFDLPNQTVNVTEGKHAQLDFNLQPTAITFHKLVVKGRRVP